MLSSLLDYNGIYKDFYSKFISKVDKSNIYSVIDQLSNNNNNLEKIDFEFKLNEKYKGACDLLKKNFALKFYLHFFNFLLKKGKVFKFLNFYMKEISKILDEEKEFIVIANYQLEECFKYNEFIKEKKVIMGKENDEIKNENNIFGINTLFLLFKKMIENNFNDKNFILEKKDEIFQEIVNMKITYLKSFNLITNKEEEKLFISDSIITPIKSEEDILNSLKMNKEMEKPLGVKKNLNPIESVEEIIYDNNFIKKNYNIEKFILQFYNFNSEYYKIIPCESFIELFKTFKGITEIIKKNILIEKLFRDKKDLLKSTYEKIDFENIIKSITNENEFNKSKEILNELKEKKEK